MTEEFRMSVRAFYLYKQLPFVGHVTDTCYRKVEWFTIDIQKVKEAV
jgi:hypothetical protein